MKKIIVCYISSMLFLLIFAGAIVFNQIPLAILMIIAFAVDFLWFTEIVRQRAAKIHRSERASHTMREYFSIDIPLDEEQDDKPAEASVRPGSRPSITYLEMRSIQKGARIDDLRREA